MTPLEDEILRRLRAYRKLPAAQLAQQTGAELGDVYQALTRLESAGEARLLNCSTRPSGRLWVSADSGLRPRAKGGRRAPAPRPAELTGEQGSVSAFDDLPVRQLRRYAGEWEREDSCSLLRRATPFDGLIA